jgi:hypothetical protein
MRLRRRSALLIVLILSLAITSNKIMDVSCSINRGITWFLNSDSKVYTPTTGSWQDIDLSGDPAIPTGATGVVLEIVNIDAPGNPHIGQVRAKGSTDDRTSGAKIGGTTQIMAFVKLDTNKIFQAYRDNLNIRFYVRGYTGADVIFFDNWIDVAGGHAAATTYTVNVGGSPYNVPPNSIVILELYNEVVGSTEANLLFSRYGASLTVGYGQGVPGAGAHQHIMVGVDSSSRFQHRRGGDTDYNNFYLVGYVKSVGFWRTTASNDILPTGTTTGSWTDIAMSSFLSNSSASIALLMAQLQTGVSQPAQVDFRKNGSSDDQHLYGNQRNSSPRTRIFYLVGVDNSQIMEAWISSVYIDAFVLGGLIDVSSPNAPTNPLCQGQTNPTHILTFTPTFSWTFSDPDPGDSQTAYQLQVSTGADGGGTMLWDTGKVNSSSSSVLYSGGALSRGVTYHWRVKTWDTRDLESPYTTDQTFKINQLPTASNLMTEGQTNPDDLTTLTPTFSWTYQDSDGDTQNQYEIEVGTSLDANDIWDPPVFSGSETLRIYSGSPLSLCTTYHVRVRVYDGFEWSNWIRGTFKIIGQPPNSPSNPLCQGQTNPTNILTFTPTLSWTFSDPDVGDSQTAYQIQVGSTAGGNDLWDTGKVSSSSSSVLYSGGALSRGVTYHWRVKTWDICDNEGPYTTDQTFKINQLPTASNLMTEGVTDPQTLKTFTPTFSWTYQDSDGDTQNQYEIEVGTSLDANDIWDPPVFSGSSTSIIYGGPPLSICTVYHVRVRVYDRFEWSNDWAHGTFQIRGATVETSTGSGIAQFDTDIGCLTQLNAVNEESLTATRSKPQLDFIHGFFSIEITNLNPSDTVNIFIMLPTSMSEGTEFWIFDPSSYTWYPVPLSDDDGDKLIIIQLVEGALGDNDPRDGVITVIGGPGQPRLPPVAGVLMPVDKVSVITPYLSALLLITSLVTSFFKKKRNRKNLKI